MTDTTLPRRRAILLALNLASFAGLAAAMLRVLGGEGWSAPSLAFLALFLLGLPWTLLGFWNAVIGFAIRLCTADPAGFTNPALRVAPEDGPVATRIAVCVAIRHEDVGAVFARLETMIESLARTGRQAAFSFHVLSDSARPEVAAAEEAAVAALAARHAVGYRRRAANEGYKAGNLRDFAASCAGACEFMIVLDADSMMSGRALLRLARVMQANPRLGILQTLVAGRPAESGFARIFQYGMRHSMRVQATGAAWWQGASGPYWGHNAIIRIAPFLAHCHLPLVPGAPPLGGPVLSHDQVEAALMRAGGYDVRVIADEFESWEENPPSLPDFIKRDLRWCQGNMQYVRLLGRLALRPMGRFQLVNAIAMYLGAPMNFLMLAAGIAIALAPARGAAGGSFPAALAFALYVAMMAIGFAPRLLGMADAFLRGAEARRYGGRARLLAGSALDLVFSLFLGPVVMLAQALFVVGLLFGARVIWEAQNRDKRAVPLREAVRGLWPQFLFGLLALAAFGAAAPAALPWALPTILPCLLAIPFACFTASRPFGRFLARSGLCAVPDDLAPAAELSPRTEPRTGGPGGASAG